MGRGSREKAKAKNKGQKQPQQAKMQFNTPNQEPTPETPEETPTETPITETPPGQLNPQVAGKKPLNKMITNATPAAEQPTQEKETPTQEEPETEQETTTEEQQETTPTETPTEAEEKKIVPKKQETKIINKIADSVESFIKHDKPLIDTINDLRECLTVLPEDRKYEIVEYVARELANATDAEGNKLFKDETEAKQFLHTISTKTPTIRYKLPIEIQKEIKEKTPKILTSLTQRNIRSTGAANKNIYQY